MFSWLKYLFALSLPVTVWISFNSEGLICFLPVLYAFVFLPIIEMISGEVRSNPNPEEERIFLNSISFDVVLYLAVMTHIATLVAFFYYFDPYADSVYDTIGKVVSMGIMCGVFGINIGHELGHRTNKTEKFIAQLMLLTSQYVHFFIEHNEGHHRNVGTPGDPASAVKNEVVYTFVLRGMFRTYFGAWDIEQKRLKRKKIPFLSISNRMIRFSLLQLAMLSLIFLLFGVEKLFLYLVAAFIGAFLLECINYIEHYGLRRLKINEFRYEDPKPVHSWNSDYIIGRLVLFELTRHSDHHYDPSRKYQILRSHEEAPQLPGGYPMMVVLALIPPLWFKIMNPRVDKYMGSVVRT